MPGEQNPDSTHDDESAETGAAPVTDARTAPPAASLTAPVVADTPARPSRSRPGLVIAGVIVGAVLVLGATFGGGVLVGSAAHGHLDGPSMRQGDRADGNGQRGDRPDDGPAGPRGGQQDSDGRGGSGN